MSDENGKTDRSPGGPSGRSPRRDPFDQLEGLLSRKSLRRPMKLTEDHILSIILLRRARTSVFGSGLFSDPAWDILLELYAAKLGKRSMTLRELAQATETPPSTAGRWLAALENHRLVRTTVDPEEPGRLLVNLTAEGLSKLERLANHWGSAFLSI